MPFTPYHFGPGLLTKSIFNEKFNFIAFVISQIIIDLESLYYLLQDTQFVHKFFHTYIGATIVIFLTLFFTKFIFKILKIKTTWSSLLFASTFGAYSHVFLDSIMHRDIKPFYPISDSNYLFRVITISSLHELCIYSGIIGCILLFTKLSFAQIKSKKFTKESSII